MKIRKHMLFLGAVLTLLAMPLLAQTTPDALKLYNEGKFDEAITACKQEITVRPRNMDSYAVLCWSLMKKRQFNETQYWANEGLKISPNDHRLVEVLGEAQYYLGNNDAALGLFQRYVTLVPNNGARIGAVYYFMGEIYIRQAKFQSADISLTTSVRYEPQNDYWWTRVGYAREMAKSYRDSAAAYDKALQLNPRQADAQRGKERLAPHIN